MGALSGRLFGSIAAALALAALLWAAQDRFRLAKVVDRFEECAKAVASPSKALADCPAEIVTAVTQQRMAAECETAIGKNDLFAERASCAANVKRRGAALTAALGANIDLQTQLNSERSTRIAAIDRAAEAAAAQANRKAKQDEIIRSLPRTASGGVRCDASCVRGLTSN